MNRQFRSSKGALLSYQISFSMGVARWFAGLLQVSVELQSSLALFERIFGYLDIVPRIADSPRAVDIKADEAAGSVTFESVRLRYDSEAVEGSNGRSPDDTQRWALDVVSFDVEPGQLVAFVGPSGGGKTSITYLVSRLYDVTEGSVRIDGLDVRDIRLSSPGESDWVRDSGELPVPYKRAK